MEKIIKIDSKNVKLRSTGAYLLRYKAQFGRDALRDIFVLADSFNEKTNEIKDINSLNSETIYNLVWVLAKTADPGIPPPLEWLDTFDEFPLDEIIPEVVDMIFSSMIAKVSPKKK